MDRLEKELRRAEAEALPWIKDNSHFENERQATKEKERVCLVAWVDLSMNNEMLKSMQKLTGTEELKVPWDEIRKKLKGMQNACRRPECIL